MRRSSNAVLSGSLPLPSQCFTRVALSWVMLLTTACGGEPRADDVAAEGWQGTTVEEGSTKTVRTASGSVWGGEGRLVEEVAIGTEIRGENDLLAEVHGVDTRDGLIYIADRILSTVRVYDMEGNHIADIGRPGEGPGEFRNITDVGIDPVREHLVVREGVGIIHRLSLDGTFVNRSPHRFHYSFNLDGLDLRVTRGGQAMIPEYYAKVTPGGNPAFVRRFYLYTFDPSGAPVDSLELPIEDEQPYVLKAYASRGTFRPAEVPFAPRYHWTVGWDGSLISGTADQYRFEIRYPDGHTTIIERDAQAIPVVPEEREAHTRRVYEILRDVDPRWDWDGPEIPDFKPWYSDIVPDRSGRIWVLREGAGRPVEGWTEPEDWRGWTYNPEWVSELWFDVFEEASGQYLGQVPVPDGMDVNLEPLIEGDLFLCLTKDQYDRPVVRRYRLELPGSSTPPDDDNQGRTRFTDAALSTSAPNRVG